MVELSMLAARSQTAVGKACIHQWLSPEGTPYTEFYRENAEYLVRFPELADFWVSADGRAVKCYPAPDVPDATVRHLYLNQVLPLALSAQGNLVFHAGAVEVDEGALAFVGESGRGKSTLTASFAADGWRFLTDDGLVISQGAQGNLVMPSHPSIRLWDDSREALIPADVQPAPALEFTSKSRFVFNDDRRFCDRPRPLRRAYFLGDGTAPTLRIERMSAAEALIEWVKHSFLLDIEEKPRLSSHFNQVAELTRRPVHFRLDFPRRFDQLASVRAAILEHCRRDDGAT